MLAGGASLTSLTSLSSPSSKSSPSSQSSLSSLARNSRLMWVCLLCFWGSCYLCFHTDGVGGGSAWRIFLVNAHSDAMDGGEGVE